jgi:hypothetical protein
MGEIFSKLVRFLDGRHRIVRHGGRERPRKRAANRAVTAGRLKAAPAGENTMELFELKLLAEKLARVA